MIIGLLKGLIVGIIVSIPVGPLGLLCIPRTLARGRRAGLAVGLGGSASDTLYSALALFALSFISGFIEAHKGWVLMAGGLIISITGIRLLASRRQVRHPDSVTARAMSPVRHIEGALNGFLISVTNPGTLVCMLWLFTFLNVDTATPSVMAAEWVGTSLGSATSWCLITWVISTFRDRITIGQERGDAVLIALTYSGIVVRSVVLLAGGLPGWAGIRYGSSCGSRFDVHARPISVTH